MKKVKLTSRIFILGIFLLGLSNQVSAEVIWQENFDSQADWSVTQGPTANAGVTAWQGEPTIPPNFSYWRVQGTPYATPGEAVAINSTNARGTSGKALTIWSDSGDDGCDSHGGWCSDVILGVVTPVEHDELYLQYYLKVQDGWQWMTGHDGYAKISRISHYDGSGTPTSYFTTGNNHGLITNDFVKPNYGNGNLQHVSAYRYVNVYFPDQATPAGVRATRGYFPGGNYGGTGPAFNAAGQPGDGQWHKYVYHIKINSAPGVADGVYEVFYDDILIDSKTDLAWMDQGAENVAWNNFAIGGNSYNHYAPMADESRQWYAVDDICVATTQADLVNCFSAAPTIIRADVDGQAEITSTDASLVLRNSVGLNMSMTNWQPSATTGDVNCDGVSNSTDAMLILMYAQELDMSETRWCESVDSSNSLTDCNNLSYKHLNGGTGPAAIGNLESRNAYRGIYWTGENKKICRGEFRIHVTGNVSEIDYKVTLWSIDLKDDLKLDTLLATSNSISGADLSDGVWMPFEFASPQDVISGKTVFLISRSDVGTRDENNFIQVYQDYDENDLESRSWNIHYNEQGIMAGRHPGDENQPEYFTIPLKLFGKNSTLSGAAPNIPENINVTAVNSTTLNIDWVEKGVIGVDHYNVYEYNTADASKILVGTVSAPTTEYQHTGLTSGTTHYYVITAVSASGIESYHSLDRHQAGSGPDWEGTTL